MNRRGFFGWLTAAVAWWNGAKASEPETYAFTQHWDFPETITFTWRATNGATGSATVDSVYASIVQPGELINVYVDDENIFQAEVESVSLDRNPKCQITSKN